MIKPVGDWMIIEKHSDEGNILMPDSVQGETFIVKEIGQGVFLESGQYYIPDIKKGDIVWMAGKIIKLPYKNKGVMLAQMSNVIARERNA